MKKLNKIFFISLIVAVIASLAILFMPTSIYDKYPNAEIYDTGFNYYLWKFRAIDQTIAAKVTAWVFFLLHFFTIGFLSQKLKDDQPNKTEGLSKYNIYLLVTNLFFIILHYVHTIIWYDALAQDTPVWSSQGSVIIMLVLILIIENRRRGLFFGKKINFPKESTRAVMKYHGIYITLATIFTFWYHPMENTVSHIIGFFYMYLLFIQMSLARTKLHQNKYFNVTLEVTVLFHGTLVALTTNNAPFAMFLFGFAFLFFVTQIYGLGLNKKTIHIAQGVFFLIAILTYSGLFNDNKFYMINEMFRIPFIEYSLVFVFVYIIFLWGLIKNKWIKRILATIIILFLSINALLVMYTMSSYQPLPDMYEIVDFRDNVTIEEGNDYISYTPDEYSTNIIIVPGGKVNPESYMYLADLLTRSDFKVTIIFPHYNLAILQQNLASKFIDDNPSIKNVIVGHSLGGVTGSLVADKNSEVDGFIALGAYSLRELDIPVLYITGSNEKILENQSYYDSFELLTDLTVQEIPGGNHAYFGFYGEQKGDNEADISVTQQQSITASLIEQFIYNKIEDDIE